MALIGDIEEAFLMVSVQEKDRDSLRFVWTADHSANHIQIYMSARLWGVLKPLPPQWHNHHLETFYEEDTDFVEKFLSSMTGYMEATTYSPPMSLSQSLDLPMPG